MARGGRADISTRIGLDGGDEIKRALADIGKTGEKALKDVGAASGAASKDLAAFSNVGRDLHMALGSLGGSGGAIVANFSAITSAVAGMTTAFTAVVAGAAAVTAGLGALAVKGASMAGEVREAAIRIGTSEESFQKLKFAIDQSGGSADGFERAMTRISEAAESGTGATAEALKALGISLKDADGNTRDSTEIFRDFADAIAKIENPAERVAKVVTVLGRRGGAELVESLSLGRAGLKVFEDEAVKLGIVLDKTATKIGDDFTDSLTKLGQVSEVTAAKVGLAFAPLFLNLSEALSARLGAAQAPIVAFAESIAAAFKPIFADIANAIAGDTEKISSLFIRTLIPVVQTLGVAFTALATGIGAAFVVIGAVLDGYAAVLTAVFGVQVTGVDIPAFAAAIYLSIKAVSLLSAAFTFLTGVAAPWLLILGGIALAVGLVLLPLDQLTKAVRNIFGDDAATGFESFMTRMRAGAGELYQTFLGTIQGIKDIWNNGVQFMADAFTEKVEVLKNIWNNGTAWIQATWDALFASLIAGINTIGDWFAGHWDKIKTGFTSVADWIVGKLQVVIDAATRAGNAISNAFSGGGGGGGIPATGMAGGGIIRGPGTGTSDGVLLWGSDGEAITRTKAVNYYGPGLFDLLNRMAIPRDQIFAALRGMRGFSLGGLVDGLSQPLMPRTPRFAAGGLVTAPAGGGGTPFTLVIDNRPFAVSAPNDVAESLVRFARGRALLSGGRKPGWST